MITVTVLITGNTYPVKDQLRALGGRWDPGTKGWRVPAAKAAEARALVGVPARRHRGWRPCGYPGCHPAHCDECDGRGGSDY